jgi:hypothetical protein
MEFFFNREGRKEREVQAKSEFGSPDFIRRSTFAFFAPFAVNNGLAACASP